MTYQPNIPTGTVPLDVDYANLQSNFQQLNNVFSVDHLPFADNTAQRGYHKIVHLLNQTVDPTTTAAAGQIYSKIATVPSGGDSQLFFKTPGGGIEQISGNIAATNGLCFAGGMRFMWGIVNSPALNTITNVTFSSQSLPDFNAIYNMQITPVSAQTNSKSVYVVSFNNSGFNYWNTSSSTSEITAFYWFAIGR